MKKIISYAIASCFGFGFSPKAPGTVGSLASLPLAAAVAYYFGALGIVCASVIIFLIGWAATHYVVTHQKLQDPGWVVIDETVGQTITFIFVTPYLYHTMHYWWIYVVGFAFFRFFDIKKMLLVKWADSKICNALGVMLDDVFAGLFAACCLWAIMHIYYHCSAFF